MPDDDLPSHSENGEDHHIDIAIAYPVDGEDNDDDHHPPMEGVGWLSVIWMVMAFQLVTTLFVILAVFIFLSYRK